MPLRWLLVAFSVFAPATALALTPVTLCNGQTVEPLPDGRVLGHIPYPDGNPADMVTIPGNFGMGRSCQLHRDAAAAVSELLAAANQVPGVKGRLHGISCFRTTARQRQIFCSQIGPGKRCKDAAERAKARPRPAIASTPLAMRSISRSGRWRPVAAMSAIASPIRRRANGCWSMRPNSGSNCLSLPATRRA